MSENIAMKPDVEWFRSGAREAYCPSCNEIVYSTYGYPNEEHEYCHNCGQRLDWTAEDEEEDEEDDDDL